MYSEQDSGKILEQSLSMSPVNVQLELTEACNLVCSFCYNSRNPVESEKYAQIIDRLVAEGVMDIVLTGGEPMMHRNFLTILKMCSEKFARVQIQTNGTFITNDVAQYLDEHGVSNVNISLHGSEQIHEQLTGVKGSYKKAIDGIKAILKTNVDLCTNFVVTAKNLHEFPEHVDNMYKIGVRTFSLTRFTSTGLGSASKSLEITVDELLTVLRYTNQKHSQNKEINFLLANSVPFCALPNDLKNHCNYCHFGSSRFYIDVNGNVLMCGMSRIKIGNILESSIKDIHD
jgi:MoaA/NifB/PqqE/SkfB family radical SAM enzyme